MLKLFAAYLWSCMVLAWRVAQYLASCWSYRVVRRLHRALARLYRVQWCAGCDRRCADRFTCRRCGDACCDRCQRGTVETPVCAICALWVWLRL